MASKVIGVEFGSDTLKLAVCSGGVVRKTAVARMPGDLVREGKITSAPAMVEFLKKTMKENGIHGGPCALVLPSALVIGHHITMPVMGEKELLLNLPFEFRDFVGRDGDKYNYDYIVRGEHDGVLDIYAAAVRKDVEEEYVSVLRKAGLKMKLSIPGEMAWCNLINATQNAPRKLCIVDIGHNTTRVNIFVDGDFVMGKDIEMAGSFLDETIAANQQVDAYVARTRKEANMNNVLNGEFMNDAYQAIAIEVMKILNFYSYTDESEGALEELYYCGGSSVIEPLRTALLKSTNMTMHHVARLVSMSDVVGDQALYCAMAAGVAIQK